MKCLVCPNEVEYPEFTSLCNRCDDANLAYAREAKAPCCGRHPDYCECPLHRREYALLLQAVLTYCPPAVGMAANDPRRDDEPPF